MREFQPTPPARTETINRIDSTQNCAISTHSAREDGDFVISLSPSFFCIFQPTPPARTETPTLAAVILADGDFNPLRPRGRRLVTKLIKLHSNEFQPTPPARTETAILHKKPTILHHISTIKSHHTPSNHRQPTLHTSKTVLIVQFFRCESPRKFMFASGSHQTI